jgi:crotonobetainyl-CoA:carnitine CoA-transferase CaiB-like acyl-CoA transferase
VDWNNFDMWKATREVIGQINKPVADFFLLHTKKEILSESTKRHISICPLSSMQDLVNDENLRARNFWKKVEHPVLKTTIEYPSEFIRSSEVSLETRFRAPLIGEHNDEVYQEIGLSRQDLVTLKGAGII